MISEYALTMRRYAPNHHALYPHYQAPGNIEKYDTQAYGRMPCVYCRVLSDLARVRLTNFLKLPTYMRLGVVRVVRGGHFVLFILINCPRSRREHGTSCDMRIIPVPVRYAVKQPAQSAGVHLKKHVYVGPKTPATLDGRSQAGSEFNSPRIEKTNNFSINTQEKSATRGGQRGGIVFISEYFHTLPLAAGALLMAMAMAMAMAMEMEMEMDIRMRSTGVGSTG
eukprot:COSAG02_NODE_3635_length_6446_cov_1.452025_5_plen_224_part_00